MSCETNIDFKCDGCGHDEVVSLKTGVTVASPVTQITMFRWPGDTRPTPTPSVSGSSHSGGEFAGYACGKCHKVIARTRQELHDYLQGRGMIGEYRDMGQPMS